MVQAPAPKAETPKHGKSSWTHSFQVANAQRARTKNLSLIWTLIVGAVLPIGLWTNIETAGVAAPIDSQTVPTTESTTPTENPSATGEENAQQNDSQTNATDAHNPSLTSQPTTESGTATEAAGTSEASNAQPGNTDTNDTGSNTVAPSAAAPVQSDPIDRLPAVPGRKLNLKVIDAGKTRRGTVTIPLKGASVGVALKAMGITINKLDRVQPLAMTAAYNNMTVRITRVRADLKKRVVTLAPEKRYKPTSDIPHGTQKTIQTGQAGQVEITERVWTKNGKVTLREPVSRRVARPVRNTVIALGTRSAYVPSRIPYHNRYARAYGLAARGGSPRDRVVKPEPQTLRPVRSLILTATGYSPDPRENGGYTRTATGMPIGYGAAAVDPRVIPLGTKLYVEGYGYAFACDTGGAIKGNRIDLAYDSYRLANTKGRKKVRVWILQP